MTSARVPCEAIKRYPVVARWRNDVDYVAAGIYCFQPYCVTGELDRKIVAEEDNLGELGAKNSELGMYHVSREIVSRACTFVVCVCV